MTLWTIRDSAAETPRLVYAEGFVAVWTVDKSVLFARSNTGERWTEAERITLEREPVGTLHLCAMGRVLHLAWGCGGQQIRYTRSANGGRHWSAPSTVHHLSRSDPQQDHLSCLAAHGRRVWMTWLPRLVDAPVSREPRPPFGLMSENGGASWRPLVVRQPRYVVALSQEAMVGGERGQLLRSEDGGRRWKAVSDGFAPERERVVWLPAPGGMTVVAAAAGQLSARRVTHLGAKWGEAVPIAAISHDERIEASAFEELLVVVNGTEAYVSLNSGGSFAKEGAPTADSGDTAVAMGAGRMAFAFWKRVRGEMRLEVSAGRV